MLKRRPPEIVVEGPPVPDDRSALSCVAWCGSNALQGCSVRWARRSSHPRNRFDGRGHWLALFVVDDTSAWVKSLNWQTKNLTETRDYAVVTAHPHEVDEVIQCFEADWTRQPFDPGEKSHMIWCVGNGRQRIAEFVDQAKHSLWVQNERYQDPVIIERLVRANRRGVKVHIMVRPPHSLKKEKPLEGVGGLRILDDVGVKVHKVRGLKLHAKLLFADGVRAIIGSINLAPGSFDSRRELAIEVRDEEVVDRIHKVVHYDWENSHPIDLTDEGLMADLEDEDPNLAEDLGIESHHNHDHEKKHSDHKAKAEGKS